MTGKTIYSIKIENAETIAASGIWQPKDSQLSEEDVSRYGPFNDLTIFNNSDKDCEVRLQGGVESAKGAEFLPAGSILKWDVDEGIRFNRPVIYNRDTVNAIAANQIIMQIRRVV